MGAPRLVDDERDVVGVGDLGEPGDVGDRAEVGRRDGEDGDRVGLAVEYRGQGRRLEAMGDAEILVDLGSEERRAQAAEDEAVDHRGVDVALDDRVAAEVGEGHADRVVAARRAVDEEPAPPCAPGLGGERLRLLERDVERIGTDVDALDARWEVEAERGVPDRVPQPRVGAGAALVPGDVEAARVGLREPDERVEIRGPPLIHAATVVPAPPIGSAAAGAAVRMTTTVI